MHRPYQLSHVHYGTRLPCTISARSRTPGIFVWLVGAPGASGNVINAVVADKDLPLLIIVITVNLMDRMTGITYQVNDIPRRGLGCLLVTVTANHDDFTVGGIHASEQFES